MNTHRDMDDKVALVTGAASGIGRASARAFAERGATVLVCDISDKVDETVALIEKDGGSALPYRVDVTSEDDVAAAVAFAVERLGRLDYAHNNAGVAGVAAPIEEWAASDFETVMRVNVFGVFYCMKHELLQMSRQGHGAIVNTASTSGLGGTPSMPGYVASKHAVVGMTRGTAVDYSKRNIRINAVCPAAVRTPMIMDWLDGDEEVTAMMNAAQPMGRMAEPEEVADAAVFLCSDAASFTTGLAFTVDGGLMAFAGGGK